MSIEAFAAKLQADQRAEYVRQFGEAATEGVHRPNWQVAVRPGKKYTKVDVGSSGRYMVENDTGLIYGIKGYGVIHRGHCYGTLDTISDWTWGGYTARRIGGVA